jgi:hypothetical protein
MAPAHLRTENKMDQHLPVRYVESAEVICGATQERCRCNLAPHDDGVHCCQCGGSWELTTDGKFTALKVPGTGEEWSAGAALCAMFGITDDDEW